MEEAKIPPKKIVSIVFISLIVLTAVFSAVVLIVDLINVCRGYYERKGLDGLFYFVVIVLTLVTLDVEVNLWFDIRYFLIEKEKKRQYKTVFHVLSLSFFIPAALGVIVLLIAFSQFLEYLTYALFITHALIRITHLIVYLVKRKEEKTLDNNISKEI